MVDRGTVRCVSCDRPFDFEEVALVEAPRAPAPIDCPHCGATAAHFVTAGRWLARPMRPAIEA
jgi:NAD-dependent SIR2 family protein deacetylase